MLFLFHYENLCCEYSLEAPRNKDHVGYTFEAPQKHYCGYSIEAPRRITYNEDQIYTFGEIRKLLLMSTRNIGFVRDASNEHLQHKFFVEK